MNLTPRQRAFVDEYLIDLNAAQAAIRAGYSAKYAHNQGSRLLAYPDVKAAIAERQKARQQRTEVTQDWALRRLVAEAEYTGEGASHAARVSALGLAMRHLGMLKADAPNPNQPLIDLTGLTDDALDRILAALGPALPPELRALCAGPLERPGAPVACTLLAPDAGDPVAPR